MGPPIALVELYIDATRQRYVDSALPGAAVQPHRDRTRSRRRLARAVRRRGEDGRLVLAWPGRRGTGWARAEGDAPDDR
jgi:hypothetical protein